MSNETQANTELEAGAVAPAPKSKFKKLILLVLVLLLVGGGAYGGYYFFFRKAAETDETAAEKTTKKSSTKKAAEDEEEAEENPSNSSSELDEALPEDEDVKTIVELQPFIVNLADDDHARYLRMTVSLGIGESEADEEKPDTIFITRIRNAMLVVLSDKKSEDVLTVKGKAQLRKELLKAAQAASAEPEVKAIYITDFIVQL